MKKPYMLIPLAALLLGLLIPVFYRGGAGQALPQQDRKNSTVNENGSAGGQAASPVRQEQAGAPAGSSVGSSVPIASKETERNPQPTNRITLEAAVVGKDGKLLFGPGDVSIARDDSHTANALDALGATGLQYAMSTRFPDLVFSVSGQHNEGQSGWMYEVNDGIPSVSAVSTPVKQGDRLIWWYSKGLEVPAPRWNDLGKQ